MVRALAITKAHNGGLTSGVAWEKHKLVAAHFVGLFYRLCKSLAAATRRVTAIDNEGWIMEKLVLVDQLLLFVSVDQNAAIA